MNSMGDWIESIQNEIKKRDELSAEYDAILKQCCEELNERGIPAEYCRDGFDGGSPVWSVTVDGLRVRVSANELEKRRKAETWGNSPDRKLIVQQWFVNSFKWIK
jgi:hypothetical protein